MLSVDMPCGIMHSFIMLNAMMPNDTMPNAMMPNAMMPNDMMPKAMMPNDLRDNILYFKNYNLIMLSFDMPCAVIQCHYS
jgi:hypothetical protein